MPTLAVNLEGIRRESCLFRSDGDERELDEREGLEEALNNGARIRDTKSVRFAESGNRSHCEIAE